MQRSYYFVLIMMVFYLNIGVNHAASTSSSTRYITEIPNAPNAASSSSSSSSTRPEASNAAGSIQPPTHQSCIEEIKTNLRILRKLLAKEVGTDSHKDGNNEPLPKLSNLPGLASKNGEQESKLKQVRDQLRDLFERSMKNEPLFTNEDIENLQKLQSACGSKKYQDGYRSAFAIMNADWTLIDTTKDFSESAHGLIDRSIKAISQLQALENNEQYIYKNSCKISKQFLVDNLNGSAANQMLTKEQQIFLITKGYALLNNIQAGDLNPSTSTNVFTPEFLKSNEGVMSSTIKTVSSAVHLGHGNKVIGNQTLDRRAYLEDIVAIVWALINESYVKGDFFKNGSFTIIDFQKHLYNFFVNYIKLAGKVDDLSKISYANFNIALLNRGAPFVYNRNWFSTHYPDNTIHQTGIDIRFEGTEYALPVLPNNMTHLILGLITINNKEYVFLKPEEVGLGDWLSEAQHALHQVPGFKSSPKGFSEKIVPQSLFLAFKTFFEQIPDSVLIQLGQSATEATKAIESFNKSNKIPTSQELSINTMVNILESAMGIYGINLSNAIVQEQLKNHGINLAASAQEDIQSTSLYTSAITLTTELQKLNDTNIRFGSEIILRLDEIYGGYTRDEWTHNITNNLF